LQGTEDGFCYVICGDWNCEEDEKWYVEVNKVMKSRIVPVYKGIKLSEFVEAIRVEFGISTSTKVDLSFCTPNIRDFTTGDKTPPVVVTTDVGLSYFMKILEANVGTNMFVKFGTSCKRVLNNSEVDGGLVKTSSVKEDDGRGNKSKRLCGSEDSISKVGLKEFLLSSEDEEFVAELETIERVIGCERGPLVSEILSEDLDDEDLVDEGSEDLTWDEIIEVKPQSYDVEFWSPFLDEDMGGSNALDIICVGEEDADVRMGFASPTVDTELVASVEGAGSNMEIDDLITSSIKHPTDLLANSSGTGKVVNNRTGDCNTNETARENRKLSDVDDEEFDIPPLFDDTEYEAAIMPDIDRADGEDVYKGKVYASKSDCQIGLAIYAIRHMFHFKQTRTKLDSFVLNCADEKCDWRVTAHEMPESGYYEIRKAKLDHTCSVETRKMYKKKATSRVIAAVYKAQYSEPVKGPVPMDLQKLILEDLRVSASYSKCYRAREKAVVDVLGEDDDSFTKLAEYMELIKMTNLGNMTNLGSMTDLVTDIEENGDERFLYMFLAFGASIQGFRYLRRVLVVDGTHLTGKYKGSY